MDVAVEELRAVDQEVVAAFQRLLPQLSRSAQPLDEQRLTEIVNSPATTVLVARSASGLVGTLTLVTFRIPTGLRARIEDVVVDEAARGHGIGAALTRAALDIARSRGARTVDLTSRPERVAANGLYQRLGFQLRNSQVYRYADASDPPREPKP
jgi:ribosomal protein S18 acetylase RimI-like enzyme